MAILTNEMFDDLLKELPSQYFFYRDDTGPIEIEITHPIEKVEPEEEGLDGRVWNPPIQDKEGNPMLDLQGNPREAWSKFEMKCKIWGKDSRDNVKLEGSERIYSLGGENGSQLRTFVRAMNDNGIRNEDLTGTKWSILGERGARFWNWTVRYLGKGEGDTPTPSPSTPSKKKLDTKIKDALKTKKDQLKDGAAKEDIVGFLALVLGKKTSDIENIWEDITEAGWIKEENNKVYIN